MGEAEGIEEGPIQEAGVDLLTHALLVALGAVVINLELNLTSGNPLEFSGQLSHARTYGRILGGLRGKLEGDRDGRDESGNRCGQYSRDVNTRIHRLRLLIGACDASSFQEKIAPVGEIVRGIAL